MSLPDSPSEATSAGRDNQPSLWVWVLCIVILNLPNFFWLKSNAIFSINIIEFVEKIVTCLLLTNLFLTLFARPWQAWFVLWFFCLWWEPLALGLRSINGIPINATLVGMAMATSPAELRNLVTIVPWQWIVFLIFWNFACWIALRILCRRREWRWGWRFRGKMAFFCAFLLLLPYATNSAIYTPSILSIQPLSSSSSGPYAGDAGGGVNRVDEFVETLRLSEAFPYELPWSIVQYWQDRTAVNAARHKLRPPASVYTLGGLAPQAEIVVLVIGESSTRNAWHFFNPSAPATTPFIEDRVARGEHLFGYSQTFAQTTSTRQAVPSMLSAQPLLWPDGTPNLAPTYSIVWAATQAGYATAWFSNQAAVGKHDGIIASYADEAEAVAFLNTSGFTDQGNLDEVLLPALRRHLSQKRRAFIVLHTMGSHFQYEHRYPRGFGPYPASRNARDAYFNSVAYTDEILDKVMETLSRDGRKSALLYVSDHGETIPGGDLCQAGSGNRNSVEAYEVPAFVWLSNSYASSHPEIVERLRANRNNPYTVAAVHQTLIDLMRGDILTTSADALSFAQLPTPQQRTGESVFKWVEKIKSASEKNPCFMLFN